MERPAVDRRDAGTAQPAERLAVQREQLAVVGRGPEQSQESGLSGLRRPRFRGIGARCPCDPRVEGQEGLHARRSDRGRLRQLSAGVRAADSRCREGVGGDAGVESAERQGRGSNRAAERMGLPLVRHVRADGTGRVLRRGVRAPRRRRGGMRRHRRPGTAQHAGTTAPDFGGRLGQAGDGLRKLEDSLGGYQPLPASYRRHRPAVQRRGAEYPGRLHLVALGIAGIIRCPYVSGYEEDVRDHRQQLRRGRRVRGSRAGESGVSRRRERRPEVAAFQRSGEALRHRRSARGVLLSRSAQRPHRA